MSTQRLTSEPSRTWPVASLRDGARGGLTSIGLRTAQGNGMDIRLRIRTREQRYILEDVAAVESLLLEHGRPVQYVVGRPETLITTIYFDTPAGTWSQGHSQTKLRARSYQDPDQWWFELKRREGTRVDKWRRPMSVDKVFATLSGPDRWKQVNKLAAASPLVPVFGVQCRRTAFEWIGLRVTIDRDLEFFSVDPVSPLQLADRLGRLAGTVVEVKREGEMPAWLDVPLAGHEASDYSKSRYSLALRDGRDRPYLIVHDAQAATDGTSSRPSMERHEEVA